MTKKELPSEIGTMSLFSEAKIEAQAERHKAIDSVLDKAMTIVERVLDDESVADANKLFPAKLVIDTYLTKEKFSREDAKLELEKKKLMIETAKLSVPGGPLHNINIGTVNIQQNNVEQPKGKRAKKELKDRKLLQAEILEQVSGVKQVISAEDIQKTKPEV